MTSLLQGMPSTAVQQPLPTMNQDEKAVPNFITEIKQFSVMGDNLGAQNLLKTRLQSRHHD